MLHGGALDEGSPADMHGGETSDEVSQVALHGCAPYPKRVPHALARRLGCAVAGAETEQWVGQQERHPPRPRPRRRIPG